MSRLALLIGANPLTVKEAPVVRLNAGKWVVHIEGHTAILLNVCGLLFDVSHGYEITMPAAGDVQVFCPVGVGPRGSGNVSVYVERAA
jgi:hypothetical protein